MKTKADRMNAGWYKLEIWNAMLQTWKPLKPNYSSETDARNAAAVPGRYRVRHNIASGSFHSSPFET